MSNESKNLHQQLRRRKGNARRHWCACGMRAFDWAYQYNDPDPLYDENGSPYSRNLDECYVPMCRSCHRKLDAQHNPEYAARRTATLLKGVGDSAEMRRRGALAEKKGVPLAPDVARFMGEAGGKARAARMAVDPELRARMKEVALRNLSQERRICNDCGKESSAAGMGNHLKASGHSGYTRKG